MSGFERDRWGYLARAGERAGEALAGVVTSRDLFCLFIAFTRRFGCVSSLVPGLFLVLEDEPGQAVFLVGISISITSMV